jgi:hypothetical protein
MPSHLFQTRKIPAPASIVKSAMLRMGISLDTSYMKAPVVKGNVFAVVFLLAARFREAAAGAAGWAVVVFASPSCGFCSSSPVGSRSSFVVNHVFAVVAGMSLC